MIHIHKGTPPTAFISYVKSGKNSKICKPSFDDMGKEAKEALRLSLLKEQGYLCAYCMKPLKYELSDDGKKNNSKVKIEHYVPRNPENELDYSNLLAVCDGGEGTGPEMQTCDTHKGDTPLHINPQNAQHIGMISYKGDGTIQVSDPELQHDLDDTLNLNIGRLKAVRKAALEAMQRKIYSDSKNRAATNNYLQKCLEVFENGKDGHLQGYCGILIWYLHKKIRQNHKG